MKLAPNGCWRNEQFREAEKCKSPAAIDIVRRAYELWEQAENLMAEIRNSTTWLNRNCKKQTNKPSRNSVNSA
jgi:hypothetical protein